MSFSDDELLRYSRQLLLDKIGFEGQSQFKKARILIVGVGGLGSPAGLYLASAGVGTLVLADGDELELTNLQRQILYRTDQLNRQKSEAAKEALMALNPAIEIQTLPKKLTADELLKIVESIDIVLDCTDNLDSRYAINQACVAHKKPHIVGAAIGFEGHFIFFDHLNSKSPCYQCLVADHEGSRADANCHNSGVLGPVLGVIGSLQALAALKQLAGLKNTTNKLIRFDAEALTWQEYALSQDPECPVCHAQEDH